MQVSSVYSRLHRKSGQDPSLYPDFHPNQPCFDLSQGPIGEPGLLLQMGWEALI